MTTSGAASPMDHDRVALAIGWAMLAVLGYVLYLILRPFFLPLGWAAVLAIAVFPLHARLERRWGPARAAAASTAAITLAIVVPALLVIPTFVREALDAAGRVQTAFASGRLAALDAAWQQLMRQIESVQPVDVSAATADAVRRAAAALMERSGLILRDAFLSTFNLVVTLFATFFLLRDGRAIVAVINRLLPLPQPAREALVERTAAMVSVGLTSAVAVAATQGLLGGIVFWALGIPSAVFWGVVMTMCCLVPFGAWLIWAPAAIFLAVDGHLARALILAGLGIGVISAADNVLRPLLVSGRTHMNGLVILVGLLGGVTVFGLLGVILGPVIVATALAVVSVYLDGGTRRSWQRWARQREHAPR